MTWTNTIPSDAGSLVIIWVNVEATTAIIGASIPVLRVFFKEVKSSARAYYNYGTGDDTKQSRIGNNTVVMTTRTGNRRNSFSKHGGGMDDDSDKSILDDRHPGSGSGGFGGGGIVRTNEITVDYGPTGGHDVDSPGYELDNMANKAGQTPGRAV